MFVKFPRLSYLFHEVLKFFMCGLAISTLLRAIPVEGEPPVAPVLHRLSFLKIGMTFCSVSLVIFKTFLMDYDFVLD